MKSENKVNKVTWNLGYNDYSSFTLHLVFFVSPCIRVLRAEADKEESLHNRAYIQLRGFGITYHVCARDVALTWNNPEGEMFSHEGKLSTYTKIHTYSTYETEAGPCAS